MALTVIALTQLATAADRFGIPKALGTLRDEVEARLVALEAGGSAEVKDSVVARTDGAMPAYTRTGNVILANANGALPTQDGITMAPGDRFFLDPTDAAAAADAGLYEFDAIGGASAKWQMTRSSDADTSAEFGPNVVITVEKGTKYAQRAYQVTNDAVTLNTTAIAVQEVPWGFGVAGSVANVDGAAAAAGTSNLAARIDHKHSLPAAVAPADVDGAAAVAGVSTNVARQDHKHSLPAAVAPADVDGAAAVAGVSDNVARQDHKHSLPAAVAPADVDGAAAVAGVSDNVARQDHKHSLPAAVVPEDTTKAAAVAGTSDNVARQDHKHDVSTASAVSTDGTNAEGSATSLARSDHTHAVASRVQKREVQLTNADLTTAGLGQVINIGAALPANAYVLGHTMDLVDAFDSPGAGSLDVEVGGTDDNAIVSAFDAYTGSAHEGAPGEGTLGIDPTGKLGGQQLTATFTATVDNLDTFTNGDLTISVYFAVVA